nr:hypothetical protein [Tanacetum cinerariifolium]
MSSITAQQTKLDLELVPKENRLDIDSSLTRRNDLNLIWKSSEISFRFAQEYQIYRAILLECLISPTTKESKAYKTYLGYATGDVPSKIARKFKKSSPSNKDSDLVPVDEEPVTKGKRIHRSVKKSSTKPAICIVIREPPVETKSKRKEKVDVTHRKGIKLLSKVALTEEAHMKEVRKKSLRYFHKLHLSGSGTAAEKPPRVDKITLPVTSEGTSDKPGVLDVTKDESTESKSESLGNEEDGFDSEQDSDGIESDSESDQQEYDDDDEVKDDDEDYDDDDDDKFEGNEDRGIDSDHVQDKKAGVEITVPDASGSHSSDLASKFLKFSHIPPNDAEIVSSLDVHVHHEVPRIHTSTLVIVPVSVIPEASPAYVAELKKDHLQNQVTALVDDHLDIRMGATREEFMNFLSASLTDRITKQVRNQLPQILPNKVSNFTPPVIKTKIIECLNQALLENLDWDNLEGDDYPFDLSKPLPLITLGNRQSVPVEFFINNDLKYLQGGISTMTYTTSTTKTKAAQYDLPGIEDMVLNIWSLVKVAYDKYAHYQEYRHGVLAKEKMVQIRKEKSSFHDQGHQQAAKGKDDDEEFRKFFGGRLYGADLRLPQRTI